MLQLAYCVVQFLEKDPTLTEPVLFLHFCPYSHSNLTASSTKLVYAAENIVLTATYSKTLLLFLCSCCIWVFFFLGNTRCILMKFSAIYAGDPWASEVLAQNLQPKRGILYKYTWPSSQLSFRFGCRFLQLFSKLTGDVPG